MNQGRIWCVVSPTVGLPLFLGSVAVTSLIVHYAVLSHVTWFGGYWEGGKSKKASLEESVAPVAALSSKALPGYVISVAPTASGDAKLATSFVVTVAPAAAESAETTADTSSIHPPEKLSLATLSQPDEK